MSRVPEGASTSTERNQDGGSGDPPTKMASSATRRTAVAVDQQQFAASKVPRAKGKHAAHHLQLTKESCDEEEGDLLVLSSPTLTTSDKATLDPTTTTTTTRESHEQRSNSTDPSTHRPSTSPQRSPPTTYSSAPSQNPPNASPSTKCESTTSIPSAAPWSNPTSRKSTSSSREHNDEDPRNPHNNSSENNKMGESHDASMLKTNSSGEKIDVQGENATGVSGSGGVVHVEGNNVDADDAAGDGSAGQEDDAISSTDVPKRRTRRRRRRTKKHRDPNAMEECVDGSTGTSRVTGYTDTSTVTSEPHAGSAAQHCRHQQQSRASEHPPRPQTVTRPPQGLGFEESGSGSDGSGTAPHHSEDERRFQRHHNNYPPRSPHFDDAGYRSMGGPAGDYHALHHPHHYGGGTAYPSPSYQADQYNGRYVSSGGNVQYGSPHTTQSAKLRMAVPGVHQGGGGGSAPKGINATTIPPTAFRPPIETVASDGGWGPGAGAFPSPSQASSMSMGRAHSVTSSMSTATSRSGGTVGPNSISHTPSPHSKLPPHPPPLSPGVRKTHTAPTPVAPTTPAPAMAHYPPRNISYYYRRLLDHPNVRRHHNDSTEVFQRRIALRIRAREAAAQRIASGGGDGTNTTTLPPFDFRFCHPFSQNVSYFVYESSGSASSPTLYPKMIMMKSLDEAAQYEADIGYNEDDELADVTPEELLGSQVDTNTSSVPEGMPSRAASSAFETVPQPITTSTPVTPMANTTSNNTPHSSSSTVVKRRNNPYDAVNSSTFVRCSSSSSIEGDDSSSSNKSPVASSDFASAVETAAMANIGTLVASVSGSPTTPSVGVTQPRTVPQLVSGVPSPFQPSAPTSPVASGPPALGGGAAPTWQTSTSTPPPLHQPIPNRARKGWFNDPNQERLQFPVTSSSANLDGTRRRLPPQLAERMKQAASSPTVNINTATLLSTNTSDSSLSVAEGPATVEVATAKPAQTNSATTPATLQSGDVTSTCDALVTDQPAATGPPPSHIHTVVMRSGSRNSSRNSSRSRGGSQRSRESSSDSGPRGRGRRGGATSPMAVPRMPETTTVIHHSHLPVQPPGGLVPPDFGRVAPSSPYLYHQPQRLYSGLGGAALLPPGHSTIHGVQQRIFEQQQHFDHLQQYQHHHGHPTPPLSSPNSPPHAPQRLGSRGLVPIGEDFDDTSSSAQQTPPPPSSSTMTVMHALDLQLDLGSCMATLDTSKKSKVAEATDSSGPRTPATAVTSLAEVARLAATKPPATTCLAASTAVASKLKNRSAIVSSETNGTADVKLPPFPKVTTTSNSIIGKIAPVVAKQPATVNRAGKSSAANTNNNTQKDDAAAGDRATPIEPPTSAKKATDIAGRGLKQEGRNTTSPPRASHVNDGGYMGLDMALVAKFLEEQEELMRVKRERQKEQKRLKEEEALRNSRKSSKNATPKVIKGPPPPPSPATNSASKNVATSHSIIKEKRAHTNQKPTIDDDTLLDALMAQNEEERKRLKKKLLKSPTPKASAGSVGGNELATAGNASAASSDDPSVISTLRSASKALDPVTRRNQAMLLAAAESAVKRHRQTESGGAFPPHSDGDVMDDFEQDGVTLEHGDECSGTSTLDDDHLLAGHRIINTADETSTPPNGDCDHLSPSVVDDERVFYNDDRLLFENLNRVSEYSEAHVEAFLSAVTAAAQWCDKEDNLEDFDAEDLRWCIPVESIGGVEISNFPPIDVRTLNEASLTVLEALVVANRLRLPVHKALQIAEQHVAKNKDGSIDDQEARLSPFHQVTSITPSQLYQNRLHLLQEVEKLAQHSLASPSSPHNRILCVQPLVESSKSPILPSDDDSVVNAVVDVPLLAHVSYEQCLRLLSWQQATGIAATVDAAQDIAKRELLNASGKGAELNSTTAPHHSHRYFNEVVVFGKSKHHHFGGGGTNNNNTPSNTTGVTVAGGGAAGASCSGEPQYYPPAIGNPTPSSLSTTVPQQQQSASNAAFNSTRISSGNSIKGLREKSNAPSATAAPRSKSQSTPTPVIAGETVLVSHPASNTNLLRVVEEHAGCRQLLENMCSQPYPVSAMERARQSNLAHLKGLESVSTHHDEVVSEKGPGARFQELSQSAIDDAVSIYHREFQKDAVLSRGKALLARRRCIARHRSQAASSAGASTTGAVKGRSQVAASTPPSSSSPTEFRHSLPNPLPAPYAVIGTSNQRHRTPEGPNYFDNLFTVQVDVDDDGALSPRQISYRWISSMFVVPPPQGVHAQSSLGIIPNTDGKPQTNSPGRLPYHPNCTLSQLVKEFSKCNAARSGIPSAASSGQAHAGPLSSSIITTNNTRTSCCPLVGAWLMSELAALFIDIFDRAVLYSRKAIALAAIEASHPQSALKHLYRSHKEQQRREMEVGPRCGGGGGQLAFVPVVSVSAPYFVMMSTLLQGHFHEQHMEPVLTKGMCQRTIGTALELGEGLALGNGCYLMALSMELLGSNPDSFALLQFSKGIALQGLSLVPSWRSVTAPPLDATASSTEKQRLRTTARHRQVDPKLLIFSLARVGAALGGIGNYDAGEELGRAALGLLRGALGIINVSSPERTGEHGESEEGIFQFQREHVKLPPRSSYITATGRPRIGPAYNSRTILRNMIKDNNTSLNVPSITGYSPATSSHFFYNLPVTVRTLLQPSTSVIPSNVTSVLQIMQQTINLDLHLSLLYEELHTLMSLGDVQSSTPLSSLGQVKLHLGCFLASYQDFAAECRILDLANTNQIGTSASEGTLTPANPANTVVGVIHSLGAPAQRHGGDNEFLTGTPLEALSPFPVNHTPNCRREAESIFNAAVVMRTIAEYGKLERVWDHPLVMWSCDPAVAGRGFALRYAESLAQRLGLPPFPPKENKGPVTISKVAAWYRHVMGSAARRDPFENTSCAKSQYIESTLLKECGGDDLVRDGSTSRNLSPDEVEAALSRSIDMLRKIKTFTLHSTSTAVDIEGATARDCFMWTPRVLSEIGDSNGRAAWVMWRLQVQRDVAAHFQARTSTAGTELLNEIIAQINKQLHLELSLDQVAFKVLPQVHLFDSPVVHVSVDVPINGFPSEGVAITPALPGNVQSRLAMAIYQQYEALIEHEKTSDQSLNSIVGNCETEWRLLDAMERLMVQSGDMLGALMACDRRHCPNTADITPMLRRRCGLPVQSPQTVMTRLNSQGAGLAVLKPQFPARGYPLPQLKRPSWSPSHCQTTVTGGRPAQHPTPAHLAVQRTVCRRENLLFHGKTPPTTNSTRVEADQHLIREQEDHLSVDTSKISMNAVIEALPNNGNGAFIGGQAAATKKTVAKKIIGAKGGVVVSGGGEGDKRHPFASYEDLLADTAHSLMMSKAFDPTQLTDFVEGGSTSRIQLFLREAWKQFSSCSGVSATVADIDGFTSWLSQNESSLGSFLSASTEWPFNAMVVYSMFWSADDVVGAFVISREKMPSLTDDPPPAGAVEYRMNIEHKWLPLDSKFWSVLLNPQSAYVQLQVSGGNRYDTPLTPQRAVFNGLRAPLFDSDDEQDETEFDSSHQEQKLPRYLSCLQTQMALLHQVLVAPLSPFLEAAGCILSSPNEGHPPTICFVADGYLGHIPYNVLYNRHTQRYLFEDAVITVSPSILHLMCVVAQQRSAAVNAIVAQFREPGVEKDEVAHNHISSFADDERECGLSEEMLVDTHRLIKTNQGQPNKILSGQRVEPPQVHDNLLPLQSAVLPSIYAQRTVAEVKSTQEYATTIEQVRRQLLLEIDAAEAEASMIDVLLKSPTVSIDKCSPAMDRLVACERRARQYRRVLSDVDNNPSSPSVLGHASEMIARVQARPTSSCYAGFDRFDHDVSRPHQLLSPADLLDHTATLCAHLQLKQKDTLVSNLLYGLVHFSPTATSAKRADQDPPLRRRHRGALILNLPCAIDQREEFCSNLCLESHRFIAPSSSIAAVWEVATYPLVVLPSIGRFAVRAIHETSIPCFRSLLVAGAPRLMMPLWVLPCDTDPSRHSLLHEFKNEQLRATLSFVSAFRSQTSTSLPIPPPSVPHNNSVSAALLLRRGEGTDAFEAAGEASLCSLAASLSSLVSFTRSHHINTGVAGVLQQQMSITLSKLRRDTALSREATTLEEITACGYWTYEGLP